MISAAAVAAVRMAGTPYPSRQCSLSFTIGVAGTVSGHRPCIRRRWSHLWAEPCKLSLWTVVAKQVNTNQVHKI